MPRKPLALIAVTMILFAFRLTIVHALPAGQAASPAAGTLSVIKVSAGALSPAFSPAVREYTLRLSSKQDVVTITPVAAGKGDIAKISGVKSYTFAVVPGGKKTVMVGVFSGRRVSGSYTVTIVRDKDGDASLKTLKLSSGNSLSPMFSASVTAYTVKAGQTVTSVAVNFTPSAYATATVDGTRVSGYSFNVKSGAAINRTVSIVVTSQAGTKRTYTVKFTRAETLSYYRTVPQPYFCLTIDDGYGYDSIKRDLDTLRKNHVNATFFVIGDQLLNNKLQPLWRQAVADGNEICYHTMKHRAVTSMSDRQINDDIAAWEKAAHQVLGPNYVIPKLARLPGGGGSSDQRILKLYAARGYKVIHWSMDTLTGAISRHGSVDRYVRGKARPGNILLTHFVSQDSDGMAQYLPWLKAHFRLVKVSEALNPPPSPMQSP